MIKIYLEFLIFGVFFSSFQIIIYIYIFKLNYFSFESLKRLFSFYENVIVRSNEFDRQKFVFRENSVCAKQSNWINVMIWKEWKHVVKSESVYTGSRVRAI